MALYGPKWPFMVFYGRISSFLAVIDPNSFGLVYLQKGCGYHLDMFIVGIMLGISSILGLPWCVAATVLCLGHVDSLKMETETSAPGEKPRFLGVREQRVTGTLVFILTGLSVKLAPILAVSW